MQLSPLQTRARAAIAAGQMQDASQILVKSLREEGENPLTYTYLAEAQGRLPGGKDTAITAMRRAVELAPNVPGFQLALAARLRQTRRLGEALEVYEQVLAQAPDMVPALSWALRLRRKALIWDHHDRDPEAIALIGQSDVNADPLTCLTFCDDPAFQLRRAQVAQAALPQVTPNVALSPRKEDGKIRLGYVSADFGLHATMHLMQDLLEQHDRDRFELYLYDLSRGTPDDTHKRVQGLADVFRPVGQLSSQQIAETMRRDQLDIAIDLKGFTNRARPEVFAARVAPVQINYLGFPGSTGDAEMDYVLGDGVIIPPQERQHYCEQLLKMPVCYQPNRRDRALPEAARRADYDLPEEGFVFASFNHQHKLGPEEFDIWMDLLRRVEGSVLWFYADDEVSGAEITTARLAEETRARGVDPARVIRAERVPQAAHMARLQLADLCLDTFNYNAHTTASDAVWAGVPMVTLCGRQFAARVAASILKAAGLDALVTYTKADYAALALDLARDPARLSALRQDMAARRLTMPLFDSESYRLDFEALLTAAHERRVAGLPPADISLP